MEIILGSTDPSASWRTSLGFVSIRLVFVVDGHDMAACLFTYPCSFRLINYLPDILLVHRIEAEGKTVPSGLELLNL